LVYEFSNKLDMSLKNKLIFY